MHFSDLSWRSKPITKGVNVSPEMRAISRPVCAINTVRRPADCRQGLVVQRREFAGKSKNLSEGVLTIQTDRPQCESVRRKVTAQWIFLLAHLPHPYFRKSIYFSRFPGFIPLSIWQGLIYEGDGCEEVAEWCWQGKTEVGPLGEKRVSVPLCPWTWNIHI